MIALQVAACAGEGASVEPQPGSNGPAASGAGHGAPASPADDIAIPAAAGSPLAEPATAVQRLFANMEATVGESRARYEVEEKAFLQHPDAVSVLKHTYAAAAQTDLQTRWKSVYLASLIRSAEAVPFLEEVAMTPRTLRAAETITGDRREETEEDDTNARLRAGAGLAESLAAGITGSLGAVQRVLAGADPAVAEVTATEVFVKGLLTDDLKGLLSARGLPSAFKKLSEAERVAIMSIAPEELRRARPDKYGPAPANY